MTTTKYLTELEVWTKAKEAYQESLKTGYYTFLDDCDFITLNGLCSMFICLVENKLISQDLYNTLTEKINKELCGRIYLGKYETPEGTLERIKFCSKMIQELTTT